MIGSQPASFAAINPASPTDPAPNTANDSPGSGRMTLSTAPAPVWRPQPSGPRNSIGASRRTLTASRPGVSAWVANEDCWKNEPKIGAPLLLIVIDPSARVPPDFSSRPCWQYEYRSARQCSHTPHHGNEITTWSPATRCPTALPAAA